MTVQDIGWLRSLLADFDDWYDEEKDQDPDSTEVALAGARRVLSELEREHPACQCCHMEEVRRLDEGGLNLHAKDGLCAECVDRHDAQAAHTNDDIPY